MSNPRTPTGPLYTALAIEARMRGISIGQVLREAGLETVVSTADVYVIPTFRWTDTKRQLVDHLNAAVAEIRRLHEARDDGFNAGWTARREADEARSRCACGREDCQHAITASSGPDPKTGASLFVPLPSEPDLAAALRKAGNGYEIQTWVRHEPPGVVVLKGHPQLGGRYCMTDGGNWPCATVRAALAAADKPFDSDAFRNAIEADIAADKRSPSRARYCVHARLADLCDLCPATPTAALSPTTETTE